MKQLIVSVLIVIAGSLHAKKQIEFEQLEYVAEALDRIQIKEVNLIGMEELSIGSTVEVVGNYKLGSVEKALLGLSITSRQLEGEKHFPEPHEQKMITKGSGEFRLLRKIDRYGGIHLSIYPQAESGRYQQSTSRLYFLELNQ